MNGNAVDWHTLLAYALTGEWLVLPQDGGPESALDPDRLLAELAAIGWSGARLARAAALQRTVPAQQVRVLGPARFSAVLAELRRRVLVGADDVRTVSARPMDADERRLAADRPPHWD